MKKVGAVCALMSSIAIFSSLSSIVPQAALAVLVFLAGGIAPLIFGLAAAFTQFILGYAVEGGLTPMNVLVTL